MPPPRKPADVSAASKERNEYIPNFIAKEPFYLTNKSATAETVEPTTDYLGHQRLQKEKAADTWYNRGQRAGPAATKFRKGACENCGSMTHKARDCLSRRRKKGAKWTGQDIQADEVIEEVQMGWDAKRDRWNGYDPREHQSVLEEYARLEELRKQAKDAEALEKDGQDGEDEEDKYAEDSAMPGQAFDAANRISTRNLRIREDTAKYLLNLDLDSAKYDPKTRSMVDSGATADQAGALVEEEKFMRASGDAAEFERAQRAAWESQEQGAKVKQHLQANPTEAQYYQKKAREEAEAKKEAQKKMLLEKYGGQEHLQAAPLRDAAVTESERFIEYDASGGIKGAPKTIAKSKYPEDKLINNHTSVWGSWWKNFQWGYACCHSMVKNSYCTGEEGIRAAEEAHEMRLGGALPIESVPAIEDGNVDGRHEELDTKTKPEANGTSTKVEGSRKRGLDEMKAGVSEEDLEEYRKKRMVADDPMANLLGKDEIIN